MGYLRSNISISPNFPEISFKKMSIIQNVSDTLLTIMYQALTAKKDWMGSLKHYDCNFATSQYQVYQGVEQNYTFLRFPPVLMFRLTPIHHTSEDYLFSLFAKNHLLISTRLRLKVF